VRVAVRRGDAAEGILKFAAEAGSDIIGMATHGRTGLGQTIFGSVAHWVVRRSTVPVLLLRPDHHPTRRLRTLLVPVDGTPGGTHALAMAVPLARCSHAKFVLVRASVPLPLWLYDPTLGLDTGPLINPMWDEDARAAAERYAARIPTRLRRAGIEAEGRGVSGQPAPAVVSLADEVDADLIVMSTHARSGPLRSILGSVANDVVHGSRRPVLLLHRPAFRDVGTRNPTVTLDNLGV
jgi:nucleotide-binding universal stress UspA family protein